MRRAFSVVTILALLSGVVIASGSWLIVDGGGLMVLTSLFEPPAPPPTGCSHGFWKNHEGTWVGFNPGQRVGEVFAVPPDYGLENDTLSTALNYGGGEDVGGGAQILLRAAVAALLNAEHPGINYPRSSSDVILSVNTALASATRETMLALADALDADNNLGCPFE